MDQAERSRAGTDGNLYGTTQSGGAHLAGILFRASTNDSVTKLADFAPPMACGRRVCWFRLRTGACLGHAIWRPLWRRHGFPDGAQRNAYECVFVHRDNRWQRAGYRPHLGRRQQPLRLHHQRGDNGYGNLFKITPGGALTPLYTFTNDVDGSAPAARCFRPTTAIFTA